MSAAAVGARDQDPEMIWVFGYGSLMWSPGLEVDGFERATLKGYHRALCIYSHVHRGTPDIPGLVFGLAPGKSCVGRALGFRKAREQEALEAYDARELVTNVYQRIAHPITLESGVEAIAWCYVARTDHEQYAGDLSPAQALPFVLQGHGSGGACVDYVRSTHQHLIEMAIEDPFLDALAALLRA